MTAGIYIRMDRRERARRAVVSALVAMELGEYAQAEVLCAVALQHLTHVVPKGEAIALIRDEQARRNG